MRINGNTTIKCGETINLSVPITGRVHSKEFDQYYSGKYLITKFPSDETGILTIFFFNEFKRISKSD